MFEKKIVPIGVLNDVATEFIAEFTLVAKNPATRMFEIEFYNNNGNPLLSRRGEVTGLPVNTNISVPISDYSSAEVQEMIDAQDKIIFAEIQRVLGLTYYDDTFTINPERDFSYRIYITLKNNGGGGEIKILDP